MTTYRGDLVDEMVSAIQALGSPYSGWTFYRYEPVVHVVEGAHCAVYFEGDVMVPEFNTTADAEMRESYVVEYWEPAPEQAAGGVVDEDAARVVEGYFDAVRGAIFSNQSGLSTSYQSWYDSGRLGIGGGDTGSIRGFEIRFHANRRNNFALAP